MHMDPATCQATDDLLAILAQQHGLDGQCRIHLDESSNIADHRIGIEPKQQIGRG